MLMLKGKDFHRLENLILQTGIAMNSFIQKNRKVSSLAYVSGMQLVFEFIQKSQQRSRKRKSAKAVTSLAATSRRVSMTDSTSLMSKFAETPFSGNSKSPPGS